MSSFLSSSDAPSKPHVLVPDVTSGHLHNLTHDQLAAFALFKHILADAHLYSPQALPGVPRPTHDDPTLLRFLRARRFDPQEALKQFADSEAWRAKHNVDALHAAFPTDEFESTRRFYPRWTGRRDQNGLPVYVYRIASLTPPLQKELAAVPPERRYERIIVLYETMNCFVMRMCSHLPRRIDPTPVTSSTTIIDFDSVSLSLLWALRSHLQEASTLATANYPETLSTIVVVNTPSFFPTVWGWIKSWFDEGTRRKVHVLGKDPGPVLRTLIDANNLPKSYGGQLDWKFEDEPALDDDTKALIGEMPKGPAVFEDGKVTRPPPPSPDPPQPPVSTS